ncbi:MAG: GIY-YIG nuclease family protein [Candidatus Absconditabacterales bacterium]
MEKRLQQHNQGKTKSTKAYLPFEIIYTEIIDDSKQAREREKYFKTGKGREELKRLIK